MIKTLLLTLLTALIISNYALAQVKSTPTKKNKASIKKKDDKAEQKVTQTGYYALPPQYVSGSISSLPGTALENLLVPNFQTALQGKIAGLQIIQASGQPASDVVIRLRGTSSIYGESQPLYVIDGVPVFSGPREKEVKGIGAGWGAVFNPLADFDPSDIESVEVLKDAASTAIYGARGSNGVILINTLKPKKDKTIIRLDHYQGIASETNRINSLNGPQYLDVLDKAWLNSGQALPAPLPLALGTDPVAARALANATNTNNLDEVLTSGRAEQLNLSVKYGSNKTSFYVSGTYHKEKGIVTGNDLIRYTGRMGITNQISKRLNIGVNTALNYTDYLSVPVGYSIGGGFNAAQQNLPVFPSYNPDGSYFFPLDPAVFNLPGTNIASFQNKKDFDNRAYSRRIRVGTNLNYNIASGLDLSVDGAMEKYYHKQSNYLSKRVRLGSVESKILTGTPTAYNGYERYDNDLYNIRTALTYKKNFAAHKFTGLAGFEFIYNENPYFFAEGEGFPSESSRQPASASYRNNLTAESLVANTSAFVGYFVNANYAYKDKYLLGATARYDGSSRFGANNKYILFPAVSAGWIVSQEPFFKQVKMINSLKLRLSYGRTGNAGIGNYSAVERWATTVDSRYLQQAGIQMSGLGSVSLKPELVDQFDLGLDFEVLNSRISGSFDYYNKVTNNLLLSYDAPLSAGVSSPMLLLNSGALRNRGVELTLSTRNTMGALKWTTDLSIAHNNNKVLDLGGLNPEQVSSHKNIATYEGKPLGVFYLAEYAGIDPANGQELIYDKDGNKVAATSAAQIDAARKPQFDKPSAPKYFGGLNNSFTYKGFDLSAFVTFSYGNYVLDEGERMLSYLKGNNNLRATAANSWTPANQNADFPKLVYNDPIAGSNTTRFLYNASYLRMKNITFGYSFKKILKKIDFLKDARVFISAQNLFTITDFPGWDPEVSGNYRANLDRNLNQGITYMDVPQVRTFAAGFNLHF